MRILVLSDSHGNTANVRTTITRELDAEVIIHLGDGSDDVLMCSEAVGSRRVILLKGNVDSVLNGKVEMFSAVIGGVNIFACHGDRYAVQYDYSRLEYAALENHAKLALFGHTHSPYYSYNDGLYTVNPGSIKDGNYAVIELRDEGILCNHKQL